MQRLTDDKDAKKFQTERFFRSEDMWYFTTREGIDFGPFTNRVDAEKALFRYLDTQKTMQRLRSRDPNLVDDYQWDVQDVANAANDVSEWRLERSEKGDDLYVDRSENHK
jgi:hypothetical protein